MVCSTLSRWFSRVCKQHLILSLIKTKVFHRQLRRVFGITNVPNLIVVKKNGDIITKAGRQEIVEKGLNVLVTWTD